MVDDETRPGFLEASRHGGALDAAIAWFGGERAAWLDLSTGINPSPAPIPPLPGDIFHRLPEASLETRAVEAARALYGAPHDAEIVAAPGSQALISVLPFLYEPTTVAIVEPTYGEYRTSFEGAGHRILGLAAPDKVSDEARIVVVVNPNNPDGRVFERANLLALSRTLGERGGLLVVDEAFADVDDTQSLAPYCGSCGLIVLRSFGKFFGHAGLRLGFGLADPFLALKLRQRLGTWPVSSPALHIGSTLMRDADICAATRRAIRDQRERLDELLSRNGLSFVGGTSLFATIRHPAAGALFAALARRHILTRPFDYQPTWLRIGNVKDGASGERLERALCEALEDVEAKGLRPGMPCR